MRSLAIALLLAGVAHAQTPGEISFWESVRDSKNPAELRAYLQQYPNGAFVPLAKARLAALEGKPVPQSASPAPTPTPPPAPLAVAGEMRMPRIGDQWTYRLTSPRLRGQWGKTLKPPRAYVAKVVQASDGAISDEVSVDGGPPIAALHEKGAVLLQQGAAIFAPYFIALGGTQDPDSLGSMKIVEPACNTVYHCSAKGRRIGTEVITVPAGRFTTTKYFIEQTWRPISGSVGRPGDAAMMTGGRRLNIWYAPGLARAVKYESRLIVGDMPPFEDPNFDLELVSYELK